MAYRYKKRCSTSLLIRKMQINVTVRYYFTSAKMASTKREAIEDAGKK